MVEVAAAEEAGVRLLLFLVLSLLRACNRGAESGERGGKCVSICGRLNEDLVFVGGWWRLWFVPMSVEGPMQ